MKQPRIKRMKRSPESGKLLHWDGPSGEMGHDITLRAKNFLTRGAGILVDVVDNYNQYSAWCKTFPDTKEGYREAKAYFDRLVAYGNRLPVKCTFPETLPEGMFD